MSQSSVDIVAVDDDEVLLSVLSEIFEECGYSVRGALDGLGALAETQELSALPLPHPAGNCPRQYGMGKAFSYQLQFLIEFVVALLA